MPAVIKPHNPSVEINAEPTQMTLVGATPTSWFSSLTNIVTIDDNGLLRSVGPGVATITATYEENGVSKQASTKVHSGNILIYGADGVLYEVPPSVWTAKPISPSSEPGIPSNEFMTINRLQGVYVNPPAHELTESDVVFVCYVLALSAIPLPPPPDEE